MAVMGAAILVAATALVVLLHRSLVQNVDARARQRLQDSAALAERGGLPAVLAGSDEDGTVAQLVVDGRVIAQSPIISGDRVLAHFGTPPGRIVVHTVDRPPIRDAAARYRVAATLVDTASGRGELYVAASLEPVDDSIHALELLLLGVGPLLVLSVGLTTAWSVGRSLEPVEGIRLQVDEITATALGRRVPEPGTGDEIDRLARTMNSMLDRLDEAVSRQRSFVSDAAHELRSPLAAIRAEIDVAVTHPDTADPQAVVERLSAGHRRLERLVEDLLVLATAEERGPRRRVDVDLDDLVLAQLQPLRTSSRVRLDVTGIAAGRVVGDPSQLERVVANLLDNAERYATTSVGVELHIRAGQVELVVSDDGPGIPVAQRERIFDRFARVGVARDRPSGGGGLGLAIARRIIEDHGGTIEVADASSGARMVVRLPAGATPTFDAALPVGGERT